MQTKRARRSDYAPMVRPRPEAEPEPEMETPGPREDYVPSVRPRAARQEGLRRLTPGYLDDLSDTKFVYIANASGSTSRTTLITPSTGRKIRVVRLSITQDVSDGVHYAEIYMGTGTTIASDETKAVDLVTVPNLGTGTTRSWTRGAGPVGVRNEVLSLRWTALTTITHKIIVEYTEER